MTVTGEHDAKVTDLNLHGKFAITIDDVFTASECQELITLSERSQQYEQALVNIGDGRQAALSDVRNNDRWIHDNVPMAAGSLARLIPYLPKTIRSRRISCLNERLRFLRYVPGQYFRPHEDGEYTRDDNSETSFVTVQIYLNDSGLNIQYGYPISFEYIPREVERRLAEEKDENNPLPSWIKSAVTRETGRRIHMHEITTAFNDYLKAQSSKAQSYTTRVAVEYPICTSTIFTNAPLMQLRAIRQQIEELKRALENISDVDLKERALGIVDQVSHMSGPIYVGPSREGTTPYMHAAYAPLNLTALLQDMAPFLQGAVDMAQKPYVELHALIRQQSADIAAQAEATRRSTAALEKSNALLQAQLETATERARKAESMNAVYDFVSACERLLCKQFDVYPDALSRALYANVIDWTNLREELGLDDASRTRLLDTIRGVKDQRLEYGHAPKQLAAQLEVATGILPLADEHFILSETQSDVLRTLVAWVGPQQQQQQQQQQLGRCGLNFPPFSSLLKKYGAPITLAAYGTSFSTSLSDLSGGAGSYIDLGLGGRSDDFEEDDNEDEEEEQKNKKSNNSSRALRSATTDRGVRDTVTPGSATIAKRTAAQDGRGKGVRFGGQSMEVSQETKRKKGRWG
ncbi:hypothetical protein HDU86_007827 [Geranomyces michiganensis]|nr:hypothetical protein HDU86_007827 [Geranomyces michiganensis]